MSLQTRLRGLGRVRWLLAGLVGLLLLIGLGFWWLTSTASGGRWLMARVGGALGDDLRIAEVAGTLRHGLQLNGIEWQQEETRLQCQQVRLALRAGALLRGQVDVTELSIDGLRLQLPPGDDSPATMPAPVELPVNLRLRQLRLADVAWQLGEGAESRIDSVEAVAAMAGDRIDLESLKLAMPGLNAEVAGNVQTSADWPLDLAVSWTAEPPDMAVLSGSGRLHGDLRTLNLEQELAAPAACRITGQVLQAATEPSLDLAVDLQWLDVAALRRSETPLALAGNVTVVGAVDQLNLDGSLQLLDQQLLEGKDWQVQFQLEQVAQEWQVHRMILEQGAGQRHAEINGSVNLASAVPVLALEAQWQDLSFTVSPGIHTPLGTARVNGPSDQLQIQATAEVGFGDRPVGNFELLANAIEGGLRIDTLRGRWGNAAIDAKGTVAEVLDLVWRVDIPDLATLWPDGGGQLRGNGTLTGTQQQPAARAELQAANLRIADLAVDSLDAELTLELRPGGAVDAVVTGAGLTLADNQIDDLSLTAQGSVENHRVQGALISPQRSLQFSLLGAAQNGEWRGRLDSLNADLAAQTWSLRQPAAVRWALGGEGAGGDGGVGGGVGGGSLEQACLTAAGASVCLEGQINGSQWQAEAMFSDLRLDGSALTLPSGADIEGNFNGAAQARGVEAKVEWAQVWVEPAAGTLRAALPDGDVQSFDYQGGRLELQLVGLDVNGLVDLDLGELGHVRSEFLVSDFAAPDPALQAQIDLRLEDMAVLSPFLPQGSRDLGGQMVADLQVAGTRQSPTIAGQASWQGGTVSLEAAGLELRAIELAIAGSDTGQLDLNGQASSGDGQLELQGSWDLASGQLALDIGGQDFAGFVDGATRMTFDPQLELLVGNGQASLNGSVVMAELRTTIIADGESRDVNLMQPARFEVTAEVKGDLATPQSARLSGEIKAHASDLTFLQIFLDGVEQTAGELDADYRLAGTLAQPTFQGRLQLRQGSARLPDLGSTWSAIELTAVDTAGGKMKISGRAVSGGELTITGELERASGKANLRLRGTAVQVLDRPDVALTMSPDLTLALTPGRLEVRGELRLPKARLDLDRMEPVVAPSSDVVVVGGEAPRAFGQPLEVLTDVRVVLGDEVTFNGAGAKLELSGELRVIDTPGRATIATGNLETKGVYAIYGQTLNIVAGNVRYAGSPIADPQLDIRATRKASDGVVAGVLLGGTLSRPESEVYTEPWKPQSEALSYLILGRPMKGASSEEDEALTRAAASIGMKRGNMLLRPLGQKLGLDDLSFDNQGSLDDARLFLGKNLSPKLYVAYGVGLLQPVNTFLVRYRLFDNFSVKAQTGARTEVDVQYDREYGQPDPPPPSPQEPLPQEPPPQELDRQQPDGQRLDLRLRPGRQTAELDPV